MLCTLYNTWLLGFTSIHGHTVPGEAKLSSCPNTQMLCTLYILGFTSIHLQTIYVYCKYTYRNGLYMFTFAIMQGAGLASLYKINHALYTHLIVCNATLNHLSITLPFKYTRKKALFLYPPPPPPSPAIYRY